MILHDDSVDIIDIFEHDGQHMLLLHDSTSIITLHVDERTLEQPRWLVALMPTRINWRCDDEADRS